MVFACFCCLKVFFCGCLRAVIQEDFKQEYPLLAPLDLGSIGYLGEESIYVPWKLQLLGCFFTSDVLISSFTFSIGDVFLFVCLCFFCVSQASSKFCPLFCSLPFGPVLPPLRKEQKRPNLERLSCKPIEGLDYHY